MGLDETHIFFINIIIQKWIIILSLIAGVPRKEKGKGKGKVHQFYFVRFWPYNDPEENSKREWVNKQVEEMDQEKKLVVDDKIQEIMVYSYYMYKSIQIILHDFIFINIFLYML